MADTNSKPGNGSNGAGQKGGQQTSNSENIRNLALIIGITILLIMGVILVAFIIAGIANNNKPTSTGSVTTTETQTATGNTTNSDSDGNTQDTIVGSLSGGLADAKPSNSGDNPTSGGGDEKVVAPISAPTPESGTETGSLYSFTAASGDSVSWLARRAMYAYMGDRQLGLSAAQRLYFETTLTQRSNPTSLNVGEVRVFSAATLQSIYSAATNLPAGELSAWNALVVQTGYN